MIETIISNKIKVRYFKKEKEKDIYFLNGKKECIISCMPDRHGDYVATFTYDEIIKLLSELLK